MKIIELARNDGAEKVSSASRSTESIETSWSKQVRPRAFRTAVVAALLLGVGLIAYRVESTQWWAILTVFTGAIVIGESLELRLTNRPPIPVSFVFIMALARTVTNNGEFSWIHAGAVVFAGALLSTACYTNVTFNARLKVFVARILTYSLGVAIIRGLFEFISPTSQWIYVVLIVAICSMLGLHELFAMIDRFPRTYGFFAAAAHASVIAGAVLVGVGYAGTEGITRSDIALREAHEGVRTYAEVGGNGLGISALLTCAIPLLVAWFSFSRYYGALRTYKQTIRALSSAPELGGIVSWGHADRVARIALAVAERLDLDRHTLQQIETAAYMHTLGDAVLDTTMEVEEYEDAEAAKETARLLREVGGMDRVADIIYDHVQPYRGVIDGNLVAQNDIAASVLRVANDYDMLSRREQTWGRRALFSMLDTPAATYNPRALEALEWVLTRERYADLIDPPEMPERLVQHLNS